MGVHHPYRIDLCADDEDPSQLIIRPGWDAPHVRCFPRTFCAWPCLLRQVGTVLGSPYDYVVAGLAYANPGSRHIRFKLSNNQAKLSKQSITADTTIRIVLLTLQGCTTTHTCHHLPPLYSP